MQVSDISLHKNYCMICITPPFLGVLTVAPETALLSARIFFSAHHVFRPYDALTLTLTLCPTAGQNFILAVVENAYFRFF